MDAQQPTTLESLVVITMWGLILALVPSVLGNPTQLPLRHSWSEYLSGSNEPRHPSPNYHPKSDPRPPAYGYEDPVLAAQYKEPQTGGPCQYEGAGWKIS